MKQDGSTRPDLMFMSLADVSSHLQTRTGVLSASTSTRISLVSLSNLCCVCMDICARELQLEPVLGTLYCDTLAPDVSVVNFHVIGVC